jgi:chromosome segregation ATPase
MSNDTERLVAEIPAELKQRVDADPRTNKEVVEAALKTEFATEEEAAVQRRVDEKERRLSNLKSERNERDREINEVREELETLKNRLKSVDEMKQAKQDDIDMRLEELETVRMEIDESHPSVEGLARKHYDGDTTAALEAMQERNDELEIVPRRYL